MFMLSSEPDGPHWNNLSIFYQIVLGMFWCGCSIVSFPLYLDKMNLMCHWMILELIAWMECMDRLMIDESIESYWVEMRWQISLLMWSEWMVLSFENSYESIRNICIVKCYIRKSVSMVVCPSKITLRHETKHTQKNKKGRYETIQFWGSLFLVHRFDSFDITIMSQWNRMTNYTIYGKYWK